MSTFLKAQTSSLVASGVDFSMMIILVELLGIWYLPASITGTIIGGFTNFSLGRRWVFKAREKKVREQILKYFIVWIGYLVLAAAGVYAVTQLIGVKYYVISKASVTVLLGISYNYLLQKKFVFRL
jgi:putative flippase GtrA